MWELSTPFMYLRWIMLKAGFGGSLLMLAVNVAFMLAFFGCRIVWGPGEAQHARCCSFGPCRMHALLKLRLRFGLSGLLRGPSSLRPSRCNAVTTLAFWNDSAAQLGIANPALPPAAIWTIR